jgi:hypothetical protein
MGLHDRIKTANGNGAGPAVIDRSAPQPGNAARQADAAPKTSSDPYAELKTKVHHACIAKLGPELFRREAGDRSSR